MKIPGFRSGKTWKKAVASVCYGFILLFVLVGIFSNSPTTPLATSEPDTSTAANDPAQTPQSAAVPLTTDAQNPGNTQPATSQQESPPVDPSEKKWTEIGSWSGSGIKSTETFSTVNNEWRINWKTSDEVFEGAGIIQVFVKDEKGNLVTLAANTQGEGEDVSYVRANPGKYYLEVNSANIKWEVSAEEQR